MKRLSIVIVTYKSEEDIYDCLQSIWQYNDIPNEDLEVIVVDNSPESEMMFSKLRELYKNDIVLIHNTHMAAMVKEITLELSRQKLQPS